MSAAAAEAFQRRLGGSRWATFGRVDVTSPDAVIEGRLFDVAVAGAMTIHAFTTPRAARSCLLFLQRQLRPKGAAIILVFRGARERLRRIGSSMDAVPYSDADGKRRLMWRGIRYAPRTRLLDHNYFVAGQDGDKITFPGVVGVQRERIWSAVEVTRLAKDVGFEMERSVPGLVEGDGATGWPFDAVVLRRHGKGQRPLDA